MSNTMPVQEPRLWGRVMKGQKIIKQHTVPCDPADFSEALEELCRFFDVQRPLWLGKHSREMEQFSHTSFNKDHFIERIAFTRLEVELILPEEDRPARPRDPRIEA